MSASKWFVLVDEKVQGPFSGADALRFAEQHTLEKCRFWCKGKSGWLNFFHIQAELKNSSNLHNNDSKANPQQHHWFAKEVHTQIGPMTFEELLGFLKTKSSYKNIHVAQEHSMDWLDVLHCEPILEKLGLNRRSDARVPIDGLVFITSSGGQRIQAPLKTISQGGFGVRNLENLSIGEVFKGSLRSPQLGPVIHFQAEVVAVNQGVMIGAKFLHISVEAQAQIISYVNQFIKDHPGMDFQKIA